MNLLEHIATALVDVAYPERCCLCGAGQGEKPWTATGEAVKGLRFWDRTHLCRDCSGDPEALPVTGRVGSGHAGCLEVVAACHTRPELVQLVGGLKYHGQRGLAWPLARRLGRALAAARSMEPVDVLVPVPLSRRRRRVRGFNQAEILARILSRESGLPVLLDVLARRRDTGQQAKLASPEMRRRNLSGCFLAGPRARAGGHSGEEYGRIGLVDDLVTSGWTTITAAAELRAAGWKVSWVLALGLAAKSRKPRPRVDTRQDGF